MRRALAVAAAVTAGVVWRRKIHATIHTTLQGLLKYRRVAKFKAALRVARRLPKTELHLHLVGSLPPEFIRARAAARGIDVPQTARELRAFIDEMKAARVTAAKSSDARDITAVGAKKNWPIFDFMNRFRQTADELADATCALCVALRRDHNVWYAEVRFCPSLHTLEGLSEDAAVRAVAAGFARARDRVGIRGGVIVCALRSYPAPHPMEMARLARAHAARAASSASTSPAPRRTRSRSPRCATRSSPRAAGACRSRCTRASCRAGWCPTSRRRSSSARARIGHGRLAFGDAAESGEAASLLARAAELGVTVEACVTGNCAASKVPAYAAHPIRQMFDAGVRVALSCDNLTLSGDPEVVGAYPADGGLLYAHPSGEVAHLVADCGFGWAEAREVLVAGARAAFAPEADAAFVAEFAAEVDRVLREEGLVEAAAPDAGHSPGLRAKRARKRARRVGVSSTTPTRAPRSARHPEPGGSGFWADSTAWKPPHSSVVLIGV